MESGTDRRLLLAGLGLAGAAMLSRAAKAGPLDPPPGPISSTGRTTSELSEQISSTGQRVTRTLTGCAEPRKNIESCPSSPDAQFVITEPGAYCVTGDVTGEPGKHCIRIDCDDVDLDCQGFNFRGVPGTRSCITALQRQNIEVYDACFSRWNDGCIDMESCSHVFVSDCTGRMCSCPAGYFLRCGAGSEVYDCEVRQCDGSLIIVGAGSCIDSCCTMGGSGGAIRCGDGSCVTECDVISHQGNAFTLGSRCSMTECRSVLSHGSSCQLECVVGYCEFSSPPGPSPLGPGVLNVFGARCCIEDNTFSNCPLGVFVGPGGDGTLIESNQFTGGGGGSGGIAGAIFIDGSVSHCMCVCNCAQGFDATTQVYNFGSSSHGPVVVCPPGDMSVVAGSSHPWSNLAC